MDRIDVTLAFYVLMDEFDCHIGEGDLFSVRSGECCGPISVATSFLSNHVSRFW